MVIGVVVLLAKEHEPVSAGPLLDLVPGQGAALGDAPADPHQRVVLARFALPAADHARALGVVDPGPGSLVGRPGGVL